MRKLEMARIGAASVLVGAAAVWPSALCALTGFFASPYERALAAGGCGAPSQQLLFLGHCPACWAGAAAFMLAGAMAMRMAPHVSAVRG